ncbi:MAG: hypothetical protein JWN54_2044 [Mycobacterium sp.]|nr:hypothetical protein [Mycobacterium sp.]
MSDGYPMAVVRADGDDVAAWLARRGVPAEVVTAGDGWVSVDGLSPEDVELLDELVRDLNATALVFSAEGDALVADVIGTDPAFADAPDDAHALAVATGRPELAAKVAEILADQGVGLGVRHRRLAELLGLPGALPSSGNARAEATGAPLEPAGVAGPGRSTHRVQTGAAQLGLPRWLPTIVMWTGVVGILASLFVAVRADTSRGLLVAGIAGLASCACLVLGMVGRSVAR